MDEGEKSGGKGRSGTITSPGLDSGAPKFGGLLDAGIGADGNKPKFTLPVAGLGGSGLDPHDMSLSKRLKAAGITPSH